MKNADMPAMPQQRKWQDDMEAHVANPHSGAPPIEGSGLTKREHIAAMAMQGLLASDEGGGLSRDTCVKLAVDHADMKLERELREWQ